MTNIVVEGGPDRVSVVVPPSSIKVSYDVGRTGRRGSIWFSGSGAPGPLTLPEVELFVNDIYMDSASGWIWQYILLPNNTADWVRAYQASTGGGAVTPEEIETAITEYMASHPVGPGPDQNYVTNAEKTKLSELSGTNTGDQVLPTWDTLSGKPDVIAAGTTQAAARTAIGAGTSNLAIGTTGTTAAAGNRQATTTGTGMVELATTAETTTGTDTTRAVTPAGLKAVADTKAPALGADDNYVTDAEKTKLANLSGVNTGDQDLSGYVQATNAPELIRDVIGSTLVAGANVTITPDDANDTITIAASGGGGSGNVLDTPWPSGSWMREPVMGYGNDNDWAYYHTKAHVFFVTHETTVDALRIYVKTQVAGSTVTLFVHDSWPSTGLPRNLVATVSDVSTDTVGWVTAILASPVTLAPGIYWLGSRPGATKPGATLSVGNPNQGGFGVGRAPIAGIPEGVITYGTNFSASYAETATFSGPNRMHTIVDMRSA